MEHARHSRDVEEQIELARRALTIGRAHGVGDLEVFALSLLGRAEMSAGRRDEGMALLEEALAAASAGRVRNLHTLGEAYCNLIEACAAAGEWERALEWCGMVDEFARANAAPPLFGACRTVHADVLLAAGRWSEAEDALETALATHANFIPQMGAPAVAKLAELRVRQGRLADAEQLLAGREEEPAALRALALLRIAEDRPRGAAALLERGLRAVDGNAVRTSQMLAPLIDARLACGDVGGAREAAEQLAALAARSGIRLIAARSHLGEARVALAAGDRAGAAESARRALAAFGALAMPLDAAEARLELARATDDAEMANDDARVALAAFRQLGATRGADAAAALLRDLGGGTAAGSRVTGRADRARARGPRAARPRDVERPDRPGAGDQREDRGPPREPDPDEARRPQPHGGRRARRPPGLLSQAARVGAGIQSPCASNIASTSSAISSSGSSPPYAGPAWRRGARRRGCRSAPPRRSAPGR